MRNRNSWVERSEYFEFPWECNIVRPWACWFHNLKWRGDIDNWCKQTFDLTCYISAGGLHDFSPQYENWADKMFGCKWWFREQSDAAHLVMTWG
jgi:hypothetical protein